MDCEGLPWRCRGEGAGACPLRGPGVSGISLPGWCERQESGGQAGRAASLPWTGGLAGEETGAGSCCEQILVSPLPGHVATGSGDFLSHGPRAASSPLSPTSTHSAVHLGAQTLLGRSAGSAAQGFVPALAVGLHGQPGKTFTGVHVVNRVPGGTGEDLSGKHGPGT